MLWLYVKSLVRRQRKLRVVDTLHFLPYLAGLAVFWPVVGMDRPSVETFLETITTSTPWPFLLLGNAVQISGFIYAAWILLIVNRHQHRMPEEFSFEEGISLAWLRYLAIGLAAIWVVVFISILVEERLGLSMPLGSDYFIYTAVTIFVFLLGFNGIRQGNIFTSSEKDEQELPASDGPRYQRSGLKPGLAEQYYQGLLDYMEKELPFLDSRLSLNQLAEAMGISPNHLSQVINEQAGQNFYQFVNSYRIETFRQKAADPVNSHLTLLAIALDCGFNSKSSFNNIFKKITGETPSEYIAKVS